MKFYFKNTVSQPILLTTGSGNYSAHPANYGKNDFLNFFVDYGGHIYSVSI